MKERAQYREDWRLFYDDDGGFPTLYDKRWLEFRTQIIRIPRYLRRQTRRRNARRRQLLEEDLRAARRNGNKAEVQRVARRIAGTSIGVKKRCYCSLPAARLTRVELEHEVVKTGGEGGFNAKVINYDGKRENFLSFMTRSPCCPGT